MNPRTPEREAELQEWATHTRPDEVWALRDTYEWQRKLRDALTWLDQADAELAQSDARASEWAGKAGEAIGDLVSAQQQLAEAGELLNTWATWWTGPHVGHGWRFDPPTFATKALLSRTTKDVTP